MNTEPISLQESKRLNELESIIKLHGSAFIAVGDALTEIRDKKLYRSEYATFEAYCKDVWGWSASRSRQLCTAASVAKSVTNVTLPNEGCARELATVPTEQRQEVLDKAAATGKVTAKSIREAHQPIHTLPEGFTKESVAKLNQAFDEQDAIAETIESELEQIKKQLRHIEIHITDSDVTGKDLILLSKVVFKMSERINALGKSRQAKELAAA